MPIIIYDIIRTIFIYMVLNSLRLGNTTDAGIWLGVLLPWLIYEEIKL